MAHLEHRRVPAAASLCRAIVVALSGMIALASSAAAVVYVDATATGAGDGTSWSDAYTDLQSALATTSGGDIWVADGVYAPAPPGGSTAATFSIPSGVALYGGFQGASHPAGGEASRAERDPATHRSVLSGDLSGDDAPGWGNRTDNVRHVVSALGVGQGTVLDGFEIRGGQAIQTSGAGIRVENGHLTIARCWIHDNLSFQNGGAGVLIWGGDVVIEGCTIEDNLADQSHGGGVWVANGSLMLTESELTGNRAAGTSSGSAGGALWVDFDAVATVRGSRFARNVADYRAGAGCFYASVGGAIGVGGAATVTESIFVANSAHNGGAIGTYGTLTAVNSLFVGNRAVGVPCPLPDAGYGGALAFVSPVGGRLALLEGLTIAYNDALENGGGLWNGLHALTLENSIAWGNTASPDSPGARAQVHGPADVLWSDVQGLFDAIPGEDPPDPANYPGCLAVDPLFVDDSGPSHLDDDLRLSAGSPLIDAARNAGFPAGTTVDLAGNLRFADDLATPDTGSGTPPLADMGAYELGAGPGPTPTPTATPTPVATPTPTPAPPAAGLLDVDVVRIKTDPAAGSVSARGSLPLLPGESLSVADGLRLSVADAAELAIGHAFAALDCVHRGRAIVCQSPDRLAKATIRTRPSGGAPIFSVNLRRLPIAAPVAPPVSITLQPGTGVAHSGSLAGCTARGATVRCR